ncbi:NRDE family protein [Nocardia sp. NPDC058379]|uniref:NRDE family protein n=1 Tax=unclassified Nocardia TaxID=2637762 RepID=UPI003663B527
MCLVLLAWRAHPEYRLIVAANRDEFYTRATESLRYWPEEPGLLAGRDLGAIAVGTWLGLRTDAARFAAVTNVRDPQDTPARPRSRGALLMDYLRGADRPPEYLADVAGAAPDAYVGYNLLVSDLRSLWWQSNRSGVGPTELAPGLHGLSNAAHVATVPGSVHSDPQARPAVLGAGAPPLWPKVDSGLTGLRDIVATAPDSVDDYFTLLADRTEAPDDRLPHTGIPLEFERSVSARFVAHDLHGTRASTVLLIREDGRYTMAERTFGRHGVADGAKSVSGELVLD